MPTTVLHVYGVPNEQLLIDGAQVQPLPLPSEAPRPYGQSHTQREQVDSYEVTAGSHALAALSYNPNIIGSAGPVTRQPDGTYGFTPKPPPVTATVVVPPEGLGVRLVNGRLVDAREVPAPPTVTPIAPTPNPNVVPVNTMTPVTYVPAGRSAAEVAFMVAGGVALFAWGVHFLSSREE